MTAMTDTPATTTQVYRVYIRTTPEAVWDAITKPEWSERYMYESLVDYELKEGGAYRAYPSDAMRKHGADMGYPIPDVVADGEVLEVDPPHRLVQTWRLLMDEQLAKDPFTRLTWEIIEPPTRPGVCKLTVTHELEGAPKSLTLVTGGLESEGAGGGWEEILSALKTLLETGKPIYTA